ncbi:DUF285 domain-containing protein [Mycoplasma feriruminatoris]|uniref:Uncharacterized protein n=2 Tax=Mycoplasma feriruminatoris TaxID=1179777 RepID=A0A654IDG0_9MOLU|nr:DUF285 domain-containing protein [Mycoplasma feriruminatoris]UKS53799.1 hypothetical protein D500_00125 [Mycoplasma feriruminatoris]VZK64986.1 hypothetical protein MF5292_00134 [Mycoplasma feriruminatoris]VZR75128.1 hypothetical protein MF5294_00131 [Mycoplasma feriruminatoris]VZR97060.1 hypothetical protein MF5293_00130 [Mycoplasma feriruminatoris]
MKKYLLLIIFKLIVFPFVFLLVVNYKNFYNYYYQMKQEQKQVKEQNHEYNPTDKSEITKIGFYERDNKVTIKQIPWYVKKVPDKLPDEIVSLYRGFAHRYKDHGELVGFEKWDTKNITDMSYAFYDNQTVNVDLSKWNTNKVKNMNGMFKNAIKFNNGGKPLDWKTDSVTSMESMFDGATNFSQSLKDWNVNNVISNKNFSRGSAIFEHKDKKPAWKNEETNDSVEKKIENKEPKVITHPSPSRPKVTIPLTKIITPATKSTSSPKTTPKPNSNLVIPKSTMTQSNQSSKKLSTPAIVGIVIGTQAVLTSLGFGIPYIIKRFKK